MADIIDKQDCEVLLNDPNFLGERRVTSSVKNNLGNSLFDRIAAGGYLFLRENDDDEVDAYPLNATMEAKRKVIGPQWVVVQHVASLYVDTYMTGNLAEKPDTWGSQDQEYHSAVFERIIYHWQRVISGTRQPQDIKDPCHNHLIPLHLFENRWGAKDILSKIINNRRTSYAAKHGV